MQQEDIIAFVFGKFLALLQLEEKKSIHTWVLFYTLLIAPGQIALTINKYILS